MKANLTVKKNTALFNFLFFLGTIGSVIYLLLLNNSLSSNFSSFAFLIVLLPLLSVFYFNFCYKKNGVIELTENSIFVKDNGNSTTTYNLSNLTKIEIFIERKANNGFSTITLFRIVLYNNDNFESFLFYLKSKEIEELKNILNYWYQNKITLKEYSETKEKMFLQKSNLTYKEIQDIKSKYNIV